jgi:DNA-directed RNA polymerase subunit RPC12/RpoP
LLTAIPRSEIVELSLDEVRKLHREVDDGELKCPRCGRGPEVMFWYQYGLTPQFFKEAGTYMRCQYCGNDEYLSCESID